MQTARRRYRDRRERQEVKGERKTRDIKGKKYESEEMKETKSRRRDAKSKGADARCRGGTRCTGNTVTKGSTHKAGHFSTLAACTIPTDLLSFSPRKLLLRPPYLALVLCIDLPNLH